MIKSAGLVLILVASVATLVVLAAPDELSAEVANKAHGGGIRRTLANFKLPKIFNFDRYKQLYRKEYSLHTEDSARSKNYFGRAFKVFISGVQYVWKRSSKFLSINEKSDWTQEERRSIYTYPTERPPEQPVAEAAAGEASDENPAVELHEVEEILGEIVSQQGENPDYAKIATELVANSPTGSRRKKRNAVAEQQASSLDDRRQVSLDELVMRDPAEVELDKLERLTNSIRSNNPDYEQIQVFSEGVDDDKASETAMPQVERKNILARKGKKYLSKVVESVKRTAINNPLTDLVMAQNREQANASLPDEVFLDYRDTGCVYHPKNQRKCGSCFIFSSLGLYEYHQCRQSGKLVPFSEQYIVDCGPRAKIRGCDGGHESQVGTFIDQYGLEQQADYPYRAKRDECPYSSDVPNRFMGHTKAKSASVKYLGWFELQDRRKVAEALEKWGPLVLSIMVNNEFDDYGGGVDRLNSCDWFSGHSMLLVGHGREDGLEYWLIRNSYGPSWGQKGYYKLSKGVPARCLISAGYSNPKFDQNDTHKTKLLQNKQKIKRFMESFGV